MQCHACSIAKGNGFEALRKGPITLRAEILYQGNLYLQGGMAMVLLHCESVLQCLWEIVKGCRNGFAALQGMSTMAPTDAKRCTMFGVWAKQRLLSGIWRSTL